MDFGQIVAVALAPIMPVLRTNATLLLGAVLVLAAAGGGLMAALRFVLLVVGICLFIAGVGPHLSLSGE